MKAPTEVRIQDPCPLGEPVMFTVARMLRQWAGISAAGNIQTSSQVRWAPQGVRKQSPKKAQFRSQKGFSTPKVRDGDC